MNIRIHTSIKVSSKLGQHVMSGRGLAHEDVPSEELKVALGGEGLVDEAYSALAAEAEEIGSCCDLADYLAVGRA